MYAVFLNGTATFSMVESNNPNIDVDELMGRIRIEAERLRTLAPAQRSVSNRVIALREPPPLRPPPAPADSAGLDTSAERVKTLHDLLERARESTEVSKRIPKPLRWLFRKQARYNSLMIQSVIPLFESVSKLIQWQQVWSAQSQWLRDLSSARAKETGWMRTAGRTISSLAEEMNTLSQRVATLRQNLDTLEQRQTSDSSFIKAELALQTSFMQRLTAGAPPAGSAGADVAQPENAPAKPGARQLDAFYLSFENRFRGSRDEIKKRLQFYLPIVQKDAIGTETRPVLDLGCGRGEWLELLGNQSIVATGVDLNEAMIAQCTERRLNVVRADAVQFLRNAPDRSYGAVSAFHLIEHLPFEMLLDLLGETLRVLQPGGLAIFESPNCHNLVVGACNFNVDPTHRRPVFPQTAQFMLETLGFERVTLEYLSPVETAQIDGIEQMPVQLRDLFYGPQDFAVIGYKSGAA